MEKSRTEMKVSVQITEPRFAAHHLKATFK